MNKSELLDLVKKNFTEEFEIEEFTIKPDTNLVTDLGLDSIDALDMAGIIEDQLDIEVNEEELKPIRTVSDVVDYLFKKISKK